MHLGADAHVGCHSKGCKDRITPLTSDTITALRDWLSEHDGGQDTPLFPTRQGAKLSRDAVEHRLAHYTQRATAGCPWHYPRMRTCWPHFWPHSRSNIFESSF